ncbi:hypothetical protein GCM10020000_33770 [Streptomyces olivoverticillatus]
MLAIDSPPSITAMALARAVTGTSDTATAAPTAQNPAHASALTTREANSTPYEGASAPATCPSPKTASRAISVVRRGSRSVAAASRGAPTTIPIAKADTSSPAWGDGDVHVAGQGLEQPGQHELRGSEGEDRQTEYVDGNGHAGRAGMRHTSCQHDRRRGYSPPARPASQSVSRSSSVARLKRAVRSQRS